MCKSHLERYDPPDRTKSPTSLRPEVIMGLQTRRVSRASQDPLIKSNTDLISLSNIQNSITHICGFHNRHSKSKHIDSIADWLRDGLHSFGYSDAHFHNYSQEGYSLKNVICNRSGSSSDGTVLLCAHYDTILKQNLEDVDSKAPGANDNASGVAALLEIARIVSTLDLSRNIQFAFFSGEEQGLWGSTHYAQHIKENNGNLHVVVNLDMCGETGYLPTTTTANIDIDDGQTGIVSTNNEASKNFGLRMEALAETYTTIDTEFDPIDASDYMPFEARGYVCIGAYDGSARPNNPHYHSDTDVIANVDMEFLTQVTKMVLAFVLSEAR